MLGRMSKLMDGDLHRQAPNETKSTIKVDRIW